MSVGKGGKSLTPTVKNNENVVDIRKASRAQLLEMLERQNKLASNKKILSSLADKGEKILSYKTLLEDEIKRREKERSLCDALSDLSISAPAIQNVEWTGKLEDFKSKPEPLAADENPTDETNPLKILASHSGAGFHKVIRYQEPEPESLITQNDIEDIYALNLCHKLDKVEAQTKFLPHKSLNVEKPITKMNRDLSAATPPVSKYGDVKMVKLEDSLKLQCEQARHLKQVELKHATERLKNRSHITIGSKLPPKETVRDYREPKSDVSDEDADSAIEEHDEYDVRDTGTVVTYTMNFDEVD